MHREFKKRLQCYLAGKWWSQNWDSSGLTPQTSTRETVYYIPQDNSFWSQTHPVPSLSSITYSFRALGKFFFKLFFFLI